MPKLNEEFKSARIEVWDVLIGEIDRQLDRKIAFRTYEETYELCRMKDKLEKERAKFIEHFGIVLV